MPRRSTGFIIVAAIGGATMSCALCDRSATHPSSETRPPDAVRTEMNQNRISFGDSSTMTEIAPDTGTRLSPGIDADMSDRRHTDPANTLPGRLRTVSRVDLERYMGKWYEVARYPNPYQDGVVGVIAEYALKDDGTISVRNLGRSESLDAELTESTATAWVTDTTTNARWYVQFIWPFKADYWIIDLDEAYQYAVVGQPERERLWILSRTPNLSPATLDGIYRRLRSNGYDTSRIRPTPQRPPE